MSKEEDKIQQFIMDMGVIGIKSIEQLSLKQEIEYRQLCGEHFISSGSEEMGISDLRISFYNMIELIKNRHCE